MLLLSFETSAKAASCALHDGERLLGECYQNTAQTQSQSLLPMAEDLLRRCGYLPADVTAVAAAAGPGSFTGIRIGVAAAKGFAFGRDIPCYGVSTLLAMALGFGAWDGVVCAVMDARREQVYNALFDVNCGKYTRICEDRAISLAELRESIQKIRKPIFLVGDGSALCYNTLLETVPGLVCPPEHLRQQRAAGVALAALQKIAAGECGDGAALTPNYLRLSQAERERLAKNPQT